MSAMQLSGHFTYRKLLRYTYPSIIMFVVTSIYIVVDGFFVSNFVGKTPFTAVNFIYPFLMILSGVGFMFGTGGSALIGKTFGEQNPEKANEIFSMLVYVSLATGAVLGVVGLLVLKPVAVWMGAQGQLLHDSLVYGGIYMLGLPASLMQYEFENLCSAAGKPKLGLYATLGAGITNIGLDALFVVAFHWGTAGAAAASVISQYAGASIPLLSFARPRSDSLLHLGKAKFDGKALTRICTNGFSELINNVSMSLVSMLYNIQLLHYVGEEGVAAYGVLMYVNLVFIGVFIGYSVGVAPIISYQYGAMNHGELKNLLKKSTVIIGIVSVAMFFASEWLAKPLSILYTGYDQKLLEITMRSFLIYSFSFLFSGFCIQASSFFTALNNGLVSAAISFLRTIVFQVSTVLIFPLIWDVDGIWLSMVAAELLATLVGLCFLVGQRKKYHYF